MLQKLNVFDKLVITTKDGNRIVFDLNEVRSINFENVVVDEPLFESEAVDLGLSVKWAPFNIGAEKPEDVGNGYTWGSIVGQKYITGKISDEIYDAERKIYCGNNKNICGTDRDVARREWGGKWRMPTANEVKELVDNCKCISKIKNNRSGFEITGPNGNQLFLPICYETHFYGTQSYSDIWSGELSDDNNAYRLCACHHVVNSQNIDSTYVNLGEKDRDHVICVRAVYPIEE